MKDAEQGDAVTRTIGWISTIAGWIVATMIVVAVGITCQMIYVRSMLNASTVWQTEMVIYLVISATLIGLPYVQKLRGHVNVDLVPIVPAPTACRIMFYITMTASIAIIAMITAYGFEYRHTAWSRGWKSETIWGVRLWIPYTSIPIGFGLLALQMFADIGAVARGYEKPFGLPDKDPLAVCAVFGGH
jgi:TRAP-type C4-dicarboxylate transport system permease small subunit